MNAIDPEAVTSFARQYLREWLTANEEVLNRTVTRGESLRDIARLPEAVKVRADGTIDAGRLQLIWQALEYGSTAFMVPRLGIMTSLRKALDEQLRQEFKGLV